MLRFPTCLLQVLLAGMLLGATLSDGAERLVLHGDSVRLTAEATDDDRPRAIGKLIYRWSREGTGLGVVDFGNPVADSTTATFSRPGPYRIRCTVSDGVREAYDEVVINRTEPAAGVHQSEDQ